MSDPIAGRLGISARRLAGRRLGVGRYIEYLVREWAREPLPFDHVTFYSRASVGDDILALNARYRNRQVASPVEPFLWEQAALPIAARQEDVLFCPSYTMPLAFPGRCVITNLGIYDHLPGSFPWWYRVRYSLFYRLSARRAHLVLAISESAKHDLARYYHIPPGKIEVVHPAPDRRFHPIDDVVLLRQTRWKYGVGDSPLILYAGKLSRRRHVPELIQAFKELKSRDRLPHKLLIVGPDYLRLGIKQQIANSGVSESIVHVPFVDHDDMPLLYNAADLYVLPTEHEGFSFTIMEAMACGCSVVTLDHPALHEGLFEAAHCATDPSPTSLAEAMRTILADPVRRARMSERALALSANFTWERSARRTLALLETAGNKGRASTLVARLE